MNNKNMKKWIITAMFSALITLMTWVPYLGYINYAGVIEITTLHIIVIAAAAFLNWKYGAVLGFVWGFNCWLRAFTNPLWLLFTNPLVSILPRVLVGIIAGLIFAALSGIFKKNLCSSSSMKAKTTRTAQIIITAAISTVIHTTLVVTAMYIFGKMFESYKTVFAIFKDVFAFILTINGSIELVAAIILVPVIYLAMYKVSKKS